MSLPIFNTNIRELSMMETQWASQLNPVITNSLVNGRLMKNIKLVTGLNTINHLLARDYQGYIVTGMHNVSVSLYDIVSPMPDKTLLLNSSGSGSIDLYIF